MRQRTKQVSPATTTVSTHTSSILQVEEIVHASGDQGDQIRMRSSYTKMTANKQPIDNQNDENADQKFDHSLHSKGQGVFPSHCNSPDGIARVDVILDRFSVDRHRDFIRHDCGCCWMVFRWFDCIRFLLLWTGCWLRRLDNQGSQFNVNHSEEGAIILNWSNRIAKTQSLS